METIADRNKRTEFLRRENVIVKYKPASPAIKTIPVVKPSMENFSNQPTLVARIRSLVKVREPNIKSALWI